MASFTDNPELIQPGAYVAQTPVQLYGQSEELAQQKYNTAIQSLQSDVNNYNSLPIANASVKQYANEKLQSLRSQLSSTINGDFNDTKFVNKIGQSVSALANDNIIQQGVSSTLNIQNQDDLMKADIAKGVSNPANIALYTKQKNAYLSSTDINQGFSGSYVSPFDTNKFLLATYNTLKPTKEITETDIQTNPDGSTSLTPLALNRLQKEGISPERINQLNQMVYSDPRVQRQMAIEAQYKYGRLTTQQTADYIQQKYNQNIANINQQIANEKQNAAMDKNYDLQKSAQKIAGFQAVGQQYVDNYHRMIANLEANPDATKTQLYTQEQEEHNINTLAYQNVSNTVVANPILAGKLALQKSINDNARLGIEEGNALLARQKFAFEVDQANKKALLDANKSITTTPDAISQTEGEKGQASFEQQAQLAKTDLQEKIYNGVNYYAKSQGEPLPYVQDPKTGIWGLNQGAGGYTTAQEAKQAATDIQNKLIHHQYVATLTTQYKGFADDIVAAQKVVDANNIVENSIKQKENTILSNLALSPEEKNTLSKNNMYNMTLNGKKYSITDRDLLDYAIILKKGSFSVDGSSDPVLKGAVERLEANLPVGNKNTPIQEIKNAYNSFSLQNPGLDKKVAQYENIVSKNPSTLNALSSINQMYKDAQQGNQEYLHTFNTAPPIGVIRGLLLSSSQLNGGNGDLGKILAIDPTDKKTTNTWGYEIHRNGDMDVIVQQGKGTALRTTIPKTIAQNASFYKNQQEFDQNFGQFLAKTGYNTSAVHNYFAPANQRDGGISDAYNVTGNKDYTVKVQAIGNGVAGHYTLAGWIYDKQGKMLLNNVELTPSGQIFSGDGIMNYIHSFLSQDDFIRLQLQRYSPSTTTNTTQQ